jgi:hypothetical protein
VSRSYRGRPPGRPGSREPGRAALRDASWFRSPGAASKYHVVSDDGGSACSGMPLVLETTGLPVRDVTVNAGSVKAGLRCQRKGCRERWP